MSHPQRRFLCGNAHDDAFTARFLGSDLLLDEGYTRAVAAELLALARGCVHTRFILDLGNVAALGSQALVLLLTLRRKLADTGRVLTLRNPRPAVADVLAVTCLDHLFLIVREETALEPTAANDEALPAAASEPFPAGRFWTSGRTIKEPASVVG
jgi:anti-anti-sigma factor